VNIVCSYFPASRGIILIFFFCETDVPDARATDDVHRRDKNVSLFVRLYLHWNVRLSSPYILIRARSSSCRYSEDASNGLPKSYRATPSTKFSTIVPNTLHSRMEMNMNSPYDPDHCFISFPDPCVSFLDLGRHGRSQVRRPSFDGDIESTGEFNLFTKPLPRTY